MINNSQRLNEITTKQPNDLESCEVRIYAKLHNLNDDFLKEQAFRLGLFDGIEHEQPDRQKELITYELRIAEISNGLHKIYDSL